MKKNSYLISLLLIWTTGSAHPFQVIEGSAQANLNQNTLTITNSDGAVLHWTDFSIAKNEKMHFIQPHTQSTVLNRVVGSDKSLIQGILSSNGKVILINPNGIHMNASALIETASFIASTFDFSISNGDLFFKNPGNGEILNEGTITCPNADIIFVANQITNTGSCTAHHVHLLSGSEVLIKPSGKKRIYIQGEQFDQNAPSYTHAIRHSGSIDAVTFQEENGQVFLISSQGTTTVDGSIHSPSGQIHLLGNEVYLTDLADIDASGTYGGTVLIGGDYQGNNPDIQNAQTTTVATGALVKANSTDAHDGGKVIYWSDGITSVGSHTDVSAGALGGDGGFIEVSGKKTFFYRGTTDRSAPSGKAGLLLFDPESNIIISAAVNSNITAGPSYAPTADTANINVTDLVNELSTGDVTITTASASGTQDGDLTFGEPLSWSSAFGLTCTVGHDTFINNPILNIGTGSLTITSQRTINIDSDITLTGGNINLTGGAGSFTGGDYAGIVIGNNFTDANLSTTNAGTITLAGTGGPAGGGGVISNTFPIKSITTENGNITLTGISPTGYSATPFLQDGIFFQNQTTISTTGTGDITLNGTCVNTPTAGGRGLDIHGDVSITATGSGSIYLNGIASGPASSTVGIFLLNTNSISTTTGDIIINVSSNDTSAFVADGSSGSSISSTSGNISLVAVAPVDAISIANPSTIETTGSITIQAVGDVILGAGAQIRPNGTNPLIGIIDGNLTLIAGAAGSTQIGSNLLTASAPIILQITGSLNITGNTPNYALIGHGTSTNPASTLTGNIQVITGSDLNLTGNGASGFAQIGHVNQTAGGSTLGGNLTVNASGNINMAGNLPGGYARIGHGGQAGAATFNPSNMTVFSGINLNMTGSTIANSNGPLDIIIDNLFPSSPFIGAGELNLSADSTLSATGPLKIYTATQDLNTIDGLINGISFEPGILHVNSATEQWGVYYLDGNYAATLFKFYYKDFVLSSINNLDTVYENIASNLVALDNLLPLLRPNRIPFAFPNYVFQVCDEYSENNLDCYPTLSPYGSFIFEDDLWWIPSQ